MEFRCPPVVVVAVAGVAPEPLPRGLQEQLRQVPRVEVVVAAAAAVVAFRR